MVKEIEFYCNKDDMVYYYHGDLCGSRVQSQVRLSYAEMQQSVRSKYLGSASWITNKNGHAVQHLQYFPFGEPFIDQHTTGYSERFRFTGKERDEETGYGYFGARYMDHELLTSFLSVDRYADKYPFISPYDYCSWNPVKLVDPDGNEAIDNDDWYKNSKGEIRWFNSSAETYTYGGEKYQRQGQTAYMIDGNGEFVYGDQYGKTHTSAPVKEVSVAETMSDFERTMRNPLVQSIHQSAADFWGNPVTIGTITLMGSIIGVSEIAFAISSGDWVWGSVASYSVGEASPNVSTTAHYIKEWLGEGRCSINKSGDPIFTSKDNMRKFRIDMNNTGGDKIHMHLERKTPGGNWKDATPKHRLYPRQ